MQFQRLAARLGLVALAVAALVAGGAVAGVRLGFFTFDQGVALMTPAVGIALLALVCGLAWLGSALKRNEGSGRREGLAALIGSLLLLWPPLHALYDEMTSPPVHDMATDPEDPAPFVVLAKRGPGMNSPVFDGRRRIRYGDKEGTVAYILHETYPLTLTKPLALIMPPAKMFWRSFDAAKRMGWTIVDFNEKEGRIEAKATSFWFGQVSDIVIRVRPAGEMGARLDMRAASESGTRDFGHNIALVKSYFRTLNR